MSMSPGTSRTIFWVLSVSLALIPVRAYAQEEACVQPPPGLVSWWPGEGDAVDVADGNDGLPLNGTAYEAAVVQQGFSFDGVDDLVSVPVASNLDLRIALTLEGWVRPAETTAPLFRLILGKPSGYQLVILPDGRLRFAFPSGSGGQVNRSVDSTSLLPGGVFTHVAATFDFAAGLAKIYVNGALENSTAEPAPIDSVATPLQIGGFTDQIFTGSFLRGVVDEPAIYSRALSDSEIQTIAFAGPAGKCRAPRADAGPDQVVNEGDAVLLDGSGSGDPLDRTLTFHWAQIAGPEVALNLSDTARPLFTAPFVPVGGATLTFQLVVNNGLTDSAPDEVDVHVKNVNHPPVADAGADEVVGEGTQVTLDGAMSYDEDGEPLGFAWTQTAGPTVILSDPASPSPTFTAPMVGPGGETLSFDLTVSDGIDTSTDSVDVVVENINHVPVADAGSDQTVDERTIVLLDGSASSDPDEDPLTYSWIQVGGTPVVLSDPSSPTPTFMAPDVAQGGDTLIFRLQVNDGFVDSAPDEVVISVLDANDRPACDLARAVPDVLWPPDHKMHEVSVQGASDPDGDPVTIRVTRVTQDEPVSGTSGGDTGPDAVLPDQGGLLLRAERAVGGNGRVYVVYFSATDPGGASCSGTVRVIVPDKGSGTAVDDGQLYDSTIL
jgi:concanavalin A-like lectin/glucanase superfamily protein/K319-like protein